jgi:hypothetical protein
LWQNRIIREECSVTDTIHASEDAIQMDRRSGEPRREAGSDRRMESIPVSEDRRQGERRTKQRRRQIDPTTCERDYTMDEIEFMRALDEYKRNSGRMFPTCSEILEVIRSLGYAKLSEEGEPHHPQSSAPELELEACQV